MCTKKGKLSEHIAAFFLILCILISNFALNSVCGYAETEEYHTPAISGQEKADVSVWTYDPLDVALHNYFSVPQNEPIGEEKLRTVRSIDVTFVNADDECMETIPCVYFSVNGEKTVTLAPTVFREEQFQSGILEKVERTDGIKETDGRNFFVQKLRAFYSEKDVSDPMLTKQEQRELIHMFPETLDGAIVVYDPYVTKREDQTIYGIFLSAGIVREAPFTEEDIRASVSANKALSDVILTFHS